VVSPAVAKITAASQNLCCKITFFIESLLISYKNFSHIYKTDEQAKVLKKFFFV